MNNINKIYKVYNKGFEPPKWILELDLEKYMKTTIVYYDKNKDDYYDLIKYRIPVNINMELFYNKELMQKYFFYNESIYNEKSSNIAVYTKTPVNIKNKWYDINVINVIAPALDSYEQIDYKNIFNKYGYNNKITNENIYKNMIEKCFIKIKKCLKKIKILVIHGFGLGTFSLLCNELNINSKKVFEECFIKYFGKSKKKIYLNNLNFIKIDNDNIVNINKNIYDIIVKSNNLNNILFVNAWDPYSLVGNGNNMDDSLDGYFGRISAMSILCWSITNPFIQYIES